MPTTPNSERVSYERLQWIAACLVLALAPQVRSQPPWVLAVVAACVILRLILAARGGDAPAQSFRTVLAVLAIGFLFLQFRTFNGLTAGTALLSLVAGLKLLETRTRRDIHVITLIIYFFCLATLLDGDSFWLLAYLIGVCWLTTATLLRLAGAAPNQARRTSIRYAGRILLQALPLALIFWLFFPRFAGPLWSLPDTSGAASSGLSDSMSPGDINELAMSDEIAFRVHFAGAAPPPAERYWRGPVLHEFDGHSWRRSERMTTRASPLTPVGAPYRYTVSMEPNEHNWIFALDWPALWDAPHAALTSDYMLVQPNALAQPLDVTATSYTHVEPTEPLSPALRARDLRLPPDRNVRTVRFAHELRDAHPDDVDFVHAVLDVFHRQPFFYTLTPPKLATNSVDAFLFDTRRGFCGHYASAFAMLMRAAGIPARVVTGYQGGTYNRYSDYWILRQSDAHAWTEVWIEGRGWERVDPTAAIAPERVEHGLADLATAGEPASSRWQQRKPWMGDLRLRLDALRQVWRRRILRFNQGSQEQLLGKLGIREPDGQKLVMVLAAGLVLGLTWLTWQVRRELNPLARDKLVRAFHRLCAKLAGAGLARAAHEGAEAYGARVAAARPDLAVPVGDLCRRYSILRYGPKAPPGAVEGYAAAVRALRIPR